MRGDGVRKAKKVFRELEKENTVVADTVPSGNGELSAQIVENDQASNTRITLKNGAVFDRTVGRIVEGPTHNQYITSDNARDLHAIRREKAIRAVQQAIVDETQAKTPYQGLAIIARAQVRLAKDDKRGRASTEAFKALLVSGGFVPTKHEQSQMQSAGVTIQISPDVLMRLVEVLTVESERRKGSASL